MEDKSEYDKFFEAYVANCARTPFPPSFIMPDFTEAWKHLEAKYGEPNKKRNNPKQIVSK